MDKCKLAATFDFGRTTAEAAALEEQPALAGVFAEVSAEEPAEAVLQASVEIPV
jgi:hypothetical protein